MFQRHHYDSIAGAIRDRIIYYQSQLDAAKALADIFEIDNPNFNRQRFMTACDVDETEFAGNGRDAEFRKAVMAALDKETKT